MQRFFPLIIGTFFLCGCPRRAPPPTPDSTAQQAVAMPTVDVSFVRAALHPEARLANKPLLADLDPKPGTEALVVVHQGGRNHELALVRGNRKVLARSPLGGKFLAHASLRHVGAMKIISLLQDGGKVLFLPVETSVKKRWICGMLIFRYRSEMLVLAGELACRCWRKQAGARQDEDPHGLVKAERKPDGDVTVEVQEEKGSRVYGWDAEQAAFMARANLPKK